MVNTKKRFSIRSVTFITPRNQMGSGCHACLQLLLPARVDHRMSWRSVTARRLGGDSTAGFGLGTGVRT